MRVFLSFVLSLGLVSVGEGAGARNWTVPTKGIEISSKDRAELLEGVARLGKEIESLRQKEGGVRWLPDVEIFHKAVQWAVVYEEFYKSNEVGHARALLTEGLKRAAALQDGKAPWTEAVGLVVRGYTSRLDGSVQPYGLVVPEGYKKGTGHRLDVWLHGRDNSLTDLKFITGRMKSAGQFTPTNTIVLHPYGRFCNAFKFAGEIDVLEAMEHVREHYDVDDQRIAIRGFSMGGAGCWHLAVHHAGIWAGAAPGAGFAETAEYAGILKKTPLPPETERTLWHLYDATDYAANLFNVPTIAYSGELDKQKQAADIMERALKEEGMKLRHIIGPGTKHKYEPGAKKQLEQEFDAIMARGKTADPKRVRFTTWTLRYHQMHWVRVLGMGSHWKRARVDAELVEDTIGVTTDNVTVLALDIPGSFKLGAVARLLVDGDRFTVALDKETQSGRILLEKLDTHWVRVETEESELIAGRKRPGVQGPIDDGFMDRFVMVRPTGVPLNAEIGKWIMQEFAHATNEWRSQFRGDMQVKDDRAITKEDLAQSNLILWGDPRSNRVLGQIHERLGITWGEERVGLKGNTFSADKHVPVMIFPNPLNPDRYVVLNTGFTFCEAGSQSNSRQTPRLPDYAVIDVTVPVGKRYSDGVVHSGFFDENWK